MRHRLIDKTRQDKTNNKTGQDKTRQDMDNVIDSKRLYFTDSQLEKASLSSLSSSAALPLGDGQNGNCACRTQSPFYLGVLLFPPRLFPAFSSVFLLLSSLLSLPLGVSRGPALCLSRRSSVHRIETHGYVVPTIHPPRVSPFLISFTMATSLQASASCALKVQRLALLINHGLSPLCGGSLLPLLCRQQ